MSVNRLTGIELGGSPARQPRHFLDLFEVTPAEARVLIDRSLRRKRKGRPRPGPAPLAGRVLGLFFEKPSLRTRVSFEAAIAHLGGNAIFLTSHEVGLGTREPIRDFARVISQYLDVLAVRTFAHSTVEELASHASIPVINALSDAEHPCQAMADMLTIRETLGRLEGVRLTFVGDGNNVACSLAVAAALLGVEFVLACPDGYEFSSVFRKRFAARFPNRPLAIERDPAAAVRDADVVYTDVWASMGQESEAEYRRKIFAPYQVNTALLGLARPEAILLHCLPAHRGEEVTDAVIDGPQSQVIRQAANRLHFQKELLLWLIQGQAALGNGRMVSRRSRSR